MNTTFNTTMSPVTEPVSPIKVAAKWALLGFLIQAIYDLAMFYLNDGTYVARPKEWYHLPIKLFIWFFPVYMAVKEFRSLSEGGFMGFGTGFKTGFLYGLFYTAFCLIFYTLFFNYIVNWDLFISTQMDESLAAMKARGMSEKDIQAGMKMATGFFMSRTFTLLVIGVLGIIFQTLAALLVAAILKRNQPNA